MQLFCLADAISRKGERLCFPHSPQDGISMGSWTHTYISQYGLIYRLRSTVPCLQCHKTAFTHIFLPPASCFLICKQHIIQIPIMRTSEGNNLYLQSEVRKHAGVCFWRLDICTAGAGIAHLERKAVWWSWDAVLPMERRSAELFRKSV